MGSILRFLLPFPIVLAGCTAALQGADTDLHTIATPDPIVHTTVTTQPPALPPGPHASDGSFRAWIPRLVLPNGDATEGHWMVITTKEQPQEIHPVKPMPRAPKSALGTKRPPQASRSGSTPAQVVVPSAPFGPPQQGMAERFGGAPPQVVVPGIPFTPPSFEGQ